MELQLRGCDSVEFPIFVLLTSKVVSRLQYSAIMEVVVPTTIAIINTKPILIQIDISISIAHITVRISCDSNICIPIICTQRDTNNIHHITFNLYFFAPQILHDADTSCPLYAYNYIFRVIVGILPSTIYISTFIDSSLLVGIFLVIGTSYCVLSSGSIDISLGFINILDAFVNCCMFYCFYILTKEKKV